MHLLTAKKGRTQATGGSRALFTRPGFVMVVLVMVHLALGAAYSLNTPIWESYDENGHYAYARYIALHRALPLVGRRLTPQFDESHQPPLYYALIAPVIGAVDTSDNLQPRFAYGLRWGVVPEREIDRFPYRGTALALRLARLVTLVLSSAGVVLTFVAAKTFFPDRMRAALLATAIYAVWPMFLFLSGVISNDPAISLFGSLTLAVAAGLWVTPDPRARRKFYVALAFALAGAALTKDSAIALFLFAGLVVALQLWRDRRLGWSSVRPALTHFLALLAVLCMLAVILSDGRVVRQFDSALDMTAGLVTTALPDQPDLLSIGLPLSLGAFEGLPHVAQFVFRTTIGAFGWGTVGMPEVWYDILIAPALAALLGLALALRQRPLRVPILLALLFVVCVGLAPFVRSVISNDFSLLIGRFLMPALSGAAILTAIGWDSLPRPLNRLGSALSLGWITAIALMTPWVVLLPAYRPPTLLDPVALPDGIQVPQRITFGDSIQLLGHSFPRSHVRFGEVIPLTLYWRALKPLSDDYLLVIDVYDIDGRSLQMQRLYTPGRGTFPTSDWKAGDTFADTYGLWAMPAWDVPTRIAVQVSWRRPGDKNGLTAMCEREGLCNALFGALPVHMNEVMARPWRDKPAQFRLGDVAEVVEANVVGQPKPGGVITLTLVWRAPADVAKSYTGFVHVISDQGQLIAQRDSPPRNGRFPTEHWLAGDIVPDQFVLPIRADAEPGLYRVKIGMYDTHTHQRLPARNAQGEWLPDSLIVVGNIQIER
ncbi:MAG: phospholipid carrier-dependent glycosyltransferase [Anaerolineae bacterium]|nr:phospholipid carrier-dependent glycosyltransferase [Thermoflexales bacterium]MDW8408344.1 phospholipid carrier-dependent glycosyltransferase [Anaerolineae bacterium]